MTEEIAFPSSDTPVVELGKSCHSTLKVIEPIPVSFPSLLAKEGKEGWWKEEMTLGQLCYLILEK
jgi:hypothetical protein